MAEQVNQRIEGMINELEQMRRANLYNDDELREVSRKRKEFEYKIQRRLKQKDDFVQYIAYELAFLEDVTLRRKQAQIGDKRKDIEYAIAKRLNKLFKQFIMRYQDDIEVYFEYIKFCKSVGFLHAVSAIIGQMLQIHGDKPKTWQLASVWESKERNNLETARSFLLKGIHRHPDSPVLYLELFEIELKLAYEAENEKEKEKCLKRAEIIWQNSIKNIPDLSYLFKLADLSIKYNEGPLTNAIKEDIWNKRDNKDVWAYIASKELEGCHWDQIDEFLNQDSEYSTELNNFIAVYEEALQQFPDVKLCKKYIHTLLGLNENICTDLQKVNAVKEAWMYGHENGILSEDLYAFGLALLKLEGDTGDEYEKILESALRKNPKSRTVWEEKLLLSKDNENKMFSLLQQATKTMKGDDLVHLWNFVLDNFDSGTVLSNCYKRFQSCESVVVLSLKPKLLTKLYEHNGLKVARDAYDDFIKTPPTQVDLHKVMIEIELAQEKPNVKNIRKCFECMVQHHGRDNVGVWLDYVGFEAKEGNAQTVPQVHRRAIAELKHELVDDFIKAQTLSRLQ